MAREPVLMPSLDVGRRLDLYGDAMRVEQVVGRPFIADAVRGPDSGGDDVLREPATRVHHRPEQSFSKSGDVATGSAGHRG